MDRQRAAPYPSQPAAPAVNNQIVTKAFLPDSPLPDHSIEPASTTRKTNTRLARSESGTVYTLLPYATPTEDTRRPPADSEDLHPELPSDHPSNPITDVDLHEGVPSHDTNVAAHEVTIASLGSPTPQGDAPAIADDDEVAAIAKQILEYCKKAGVTPRIGSKTGGEEER